MFTIPQQCVRHRLVILDKVDKFDNIEGILLPQWGAVVHLMRFTNMSVVASPIHFFKQLGSSVQE